MAHSILGDAGARFLSCDKAERSSNMHLPLGWAGLLAEITPRPNGLPDNNLASGIALLDTAVPCALTPSPTRTKLRTMLINR